MAKILVITSLAESLLNFRSELLQAMSNRGHQVRACAPAPEAEDTLARLQRLNVEFGEIYMRRTSINPFDDLRTCLSIWRQLRQVRPDVVTAYTIKSVIYGMLLARWFGVKRRYAFITGLGYAFYMSDPSLRRRVIGWLARTLYRYALRGVTVVFFENPDDKQVFEKYRLAGGATKLKVVNGVGVNLAHYSAAPLPEGPIFLMIARLLADKGLREYVSAAAIVKQRVPAAECHLVGPFDINPTAITPSELKQWTDAGTIIYHGASRDVRPFLSMCSVFVLPSYGEGTPRTVLEAMATGRAIITTDAPGCRETVLPGQNGLMVPVRDAKALAEAMIRLAENPELRSQMGAESLIIAQKRYDVHGVVADVLVAMAL